MKNVYFFACVLSLIFSIYSTAEQSTRRLCSGAKSNEINLYVKDIQQFIIDHDSSLSKQDVQHILCMLTLLSKKAQEQEELLKQHDQTMQQFHATMNNKVNIIQETVDAQFVDFHATWTTLGTVEDTSIEAAQLTTVERIDDADLSVIQWLKTIYRKLCC